ncbi:MAG: tRNA pseudouridine(38-40) synthase TruA [Bifidobacteriaceae bacterium]|jgi:tRNA pseudouridine38-40 synthase|nr:tRNA pseudouridine(38-40) synthase TruA [Bifidobacteriaceae bacterium]
MNKKYKVTLSYDGTDFFGWGIQPDRRTIQGSIEDALSTIFNEHIPTIVAGRTDAGVHAIAQEFEFSCSDLLTQKIVGHGDWVFEEAFKIRVNSILDGDLRIISIEEVSGEFSARFSALSRTYYYLISDAKTSPSPILNRYTYCDYAELDVDAMNKAANSILGLHDFFSFSKHRDKATTIRDLKQFEFVRIDLNKSDPQTYKNLPFAVDGLIACKLTADAFAHNMVRSLIRASLLIGKNQKPVSWLKEKLDEKQREGSTGPIDSKGLYFAGVQYPDLHDDQFLRAHNEETKTRREILPVSDSK